MVLNMKILVADSQETSVDLVDFFQTGLIFSQNYTSDFGLKLSACLHINKSTKNIGETEVNIFFQYKSILS